MKITAPHDAIGALARVLYDAGINAAVIQRTGTGWIVELLAPPDADLRAAVERTGAVVLEARR